MVKPTYYKALWHNCNRCRIHYMSDDPALKAYLCDDCWDTIPHFRVGKLQQRKKIVKKNQDYTWGQIALYTVGNLCCLIVIGYYLIIKQEEKMKYRKCTQCGQHNENVIDDVCFECREHEYQLNLGE